MPMLRVQGGGRLEGQRPQARAREHLGGVGGGGGGRESVRPVSPIDGVAPFSISDLPGASRLSPAEFSLCEMLALSPLQFQQIKQTIVNISLVRGHVTQGNVAQSLVHVDVAKIAGVYDFVISAGWANRTDMVGGGVTGEA